MTKYEELVDLICESEILYISTNSSRIPAQSIRTDREYGILFNETAYATTAERRIALAHEKAHCDTGSLHSVHAPLITVAQCEQRAWRKTVSDLIPFDEMKEVFNACIYADGLDIYEFAEKLEVTPKFAKMAIEYYHSTGKRW